jgi:hypothetical protein
MEILHFQVTPSIIFGEQIDTEATDTGEEQLMKEIGTGIGIEMATMEGIYFNICNIKKMFLYKYIFS